MERLISRRGAGCHVQIVRSSSPSPPRRRHPSKATVMHSQVASINIVYSRTPPEARACYRTVVSSLPQRTPSFVIALNMTQIKVSTSRDPPSPSASFYDVSDDEEGGYKTIAHSKTGKGVKLLFSKSKVRISSYTNGGTYAPI